MSKICVLGQGYIGLPTALLFANNGHEVVGIDVNKRVVDTLKAGKMPFEEKGFQELLDGAIARKAFRAESLVEEADAFLVAVPTPFDSEMRMADLKYVVSACEMIVPHLRKGNLVIIESTIPPNTCDKQIKQILEKSTLKMCEDFYVSHCPERAIPGNTLHEMVYNDRVIGGVNEKSTQFTADLYSSFVKGNLHLTTSTTAEMIKLMENTFRDVNIALANEFAQIADDYGIDVWKAIEIANKHPRVNILKPGPGVGGHCIAIDPWFLTENANNSSLIMMSRQINDSMPQYVLKMVKEMLAGIENPTITVFGVAYKGDIADTRATPAKKFIKLAEKEGFKVKIYDPFVKEWSYPILGLEEAVEGSDCIVVLTDHSEFREMDPREFCGKMSYLNLIDTRNVINFELWEQVGYNMAQLGKINNLEHQKQL
ncbi:nucleotide sugar dehydrogenase [Methanosarcina mazei]|uniref:UDP-N-acetyl-D-mannosamine dehydrogenase n=1 Tax=Methanosarcina mazei TaxID=2209 RepID=A0A0F8ILP1_METMZ|nr:nucleotide sugar dehydrogenase [Methanosarcina mazei]KKG56893.1 UDP-N-acetyl-D-mannosamine dehydrogenase [Methanosarcina mazei]KKG57595.1 UDP-N-acetyl-D-mannosamine dehydrogenase [Methanosarcina mazei]KKG63398.1 UDP-N-acetyl-D-mannosamine dehydrogenase [Methanosarcina mazei]